MHFPAAAPTLSAMPTSLSMPRSGSAVIAVASAPTGHLLCSRCLSPLGFRALLETPSAAWLMPRRVDWRVGWGAHRAACVLPSRVSRVYPERGCPKPWVRLEDRASFGCWVLVLTLPYAVLSYGDFGTGFSHMHGPLAREVVCCDEYCTGSRNRPALVSTEKGGASARYDPPVTQFPTQEAQAPLRACVGRPEHRDLWISRGWVNPCL